MTRTQFDATAGPDGALFVGSPATVVSKIVRVAKGLGLARFDLKYSAGTLPHDRLMRCIELDAAKVAPTESARRILRRFPTRNAMSASAASAPAESAPADQRLRPAMRCSSTTPVGW